MASEYGVLEFSSTFMERKTAVLLLALLGPDRFPALAAADVEDCILENIEKRSLHFFLKTGFWF